MSKSRTCPQCGAAATGNFCGNCGAAVGARHCTQCGASLTPGAKFCTQCGASSSGSRAGASVGSTSGGTGGGESNMAWWAAGGLLIVLILVVAWPILRPDQVAPPPVGATPGAAGPGAVDLASMTPREAADRLFERVMSASSAGDSAQAAQFLPMAIQAYDRARPLDLHGLFDLSTLQRTAGDFDAAQATAEEGLAEDADHLLLLYAAAEAAREAGRDDEAGAHYRRILDVYDAEFASGNVDYQAHANMMASVRDDARAFMGGGQ